MHSFFFLFLAFTVETLGDLRHFQFDSGAGGGRGCSTVETLGECFRFQFESGRKGDVSGALGGPVCRLRL